MRSRRCYPKKLPRMIRPLLPWHILGPRTGSGKDRLPAPAWWAPRGFRCEHYAESRGALITNMAKINHARSQGKKLVFTLDGNPLASDVQPMVSPNWLGLPISLGLSGGSLEGFPWPDRIWHLKNGG